VGSEGPRPPRPDTSPRAGSAPAGPPVLATRSGPLALDRVVVVGVLNATPDSFSDGGLHQDPGRAAAVAVRMVEEGARMLDLGAESTRPGAAPVPADEELRRLLPVLGAVRAAVRVPLSVDTMKAAVAAAALDAGADVVNDVTAGRFDPDLLPLCGRRGVPVVLTHMQGTPATMQDRPHYTDVGAEVAAFLAERARAAVAAGVRPDAVVVDPGIGFGKTVEHNCRLVARLDLVAALGYPVMVGVSRKAFLGRLLGGRPPGERLLGTAAAVALAVAGGARLVRVHDVGAMRDAVAVAEAVTVAGR
jgi:dihydropteroate synthase